MYEKYNNSKLISVAIIFALLFLVNCSYLLFRILFSLAVIISIRRLLDTSFALSSPAAVRFLFNRLYIVFFLLLASPEANGALVFTWV